MICSTPLTDSRGIIHKRSQLTAERLRMQRAKREIQAGWSAEEREERRQTAAAKQRELFALLFADRGLELAAS
jgi:hypothetical protein